MKIEMERNIRHQNNAVSLPPKRFSFHQHQHGKFAQHEELIKYINDAWHKVSEPGPHGGPVFYKSAPEPRLIEFQPFDLEGWWGRRVVQNIHNKRGHQ